MVPLTRDLAHAQQDRPDALPRPDVDQTSGRHHHRAPEAEKEIIIHILKWQPGLPDHPLFHLIREYGARAISPVARRIVRSLTIRYVSDDPLQPVVQDRLE